MRQSFASRNAIFCLLSVPLITRWHINTYYSMHKRHQGSTRQTERVNHRAAGCRELKEQDYCVRKRKELFSRTQKIVKLNITTQRKELGLLTLDLAEKKFWWLKEIPGGYFLVRGQWGWPMNGVVFSRLDWLYWGCTFSDFWGEKVLHIYC